MKSITEQKYDQYQTDIKFQLAAIKQELKDHAKMAKANGCDWGHIGDLSRVKVSLSELGNFITCETIEKINASIK